METTEWVVNRLPKNLQPLSVLFGGILIQLSLGGIYTFGNMLPYLISYIRRRVDPSVTSGTLIWLQTLMAGIPFAVLFGGYLEKKIGPRQATFVGCALYTTSCALTYYTLQKSLLLVMLSLGLFATSGLGIAYNAVLILAQQWYPFRIGLASGLIVGGFGFSAFIVSPIQTKYINSNNYVVDEKEIFTQDDLLDRVPKVFLLLSAIYAILQTVGLLFLCRPTKVCIHIADLLNLLKFLSQISPQIPANSDEEEFFLEAEVKDPNIIEVLQNKTFWMLFLTASLNCLWIFTTSGLFKAYGQKFIKNDFFLAEVSSLASVFNCLSRVLFGQVVDKTSYQFCMLIVCVLSTLLMWSLRLSKLLQSSVMFAIWVCMMFSCIGAVYTLLPYATNKCFGKKNFGVLYGVIQLALSVAGVGAALLTQFVLSVSNFETLFFIVGMFPMFSLLLTILLPKTKFGKLSSS
uniref:MFS domain-containing protein n=1 Tax=Syphacia muris TaxID=451379 RepID=A0A0N5AGU6_9BILA